MVVVVSVNYHNALPLVADFKCPFQSKNLSRSISPNNFSIQKHTASLFTPIKTVHHRGLVVKGENGGSNSEPNKAQDEEVDNLGVKAALSVLKFYKREISPLLLNSCRYVPTCSEYSMEAYKRYGFVKGTILTTWRLCRCNPIGGSGFDPPRWFGETRRLPEE